MVFTGFSSLGASVQKHPAIFLRPSGNHSPTIRQSVGIASANRLGEKSGNTVTLIGSAFKTYLWLFPEANPTWRIYRSPTDSKTGKANRQLRAPPAAWKPAAALTLGYCARSACSKAPLAFMSQGTSRAPKANYVTQMFE